MAHAHDDLRTDPISLRAAEPSPSWGYLAVEVAIAVGIAALTFGWVALLVRTLVSLI